MLLKHNHFHLSEAHYKNKPKTPRPPLYIAEYNSAYSSIAPLSGLFHKLHWEQIIYACMYMHVYVCICMYECVCIWACICHQPKCICHLDSCQHTISYVGHTISYNSDESIRYRMFLHTISYVAISYVKTYDIVLRYGIIEHTMSYHLMYDVATYDIVCITYDVVCNIRCRMFHIRCRILQSYATSYDVGNTSSSGILYPWYEAVQGGTYWYVEVE